MNTGVWRRSELVDRLGSYGLRKLVAAGRLTSVGYGWYAVPTAKREVLSAVRAGGRLGCLSGCGLHGLWVPPHQGVHITFGRQVPSALPVGVVGHSAREIGRNSAVRSLLDCLHEVVLHHDIETALIVLDSALNRGLVTESDVRQLVMGGPKDTLRILHYLDGRADSGTETRVRYFFQRRRVPVTPQAYVPGVGRIDLLVGRSLMIECDSRAHHTSEASYARDRNRDLLLVSDDNRVLRLTFEHVFHQWPRTQDILVRMLRARLHRRPPLSARRRDWSTS